MASEADALTTPVGAASGAVGGVPAPGLRFALVAGAALGVAFALSPLTVVWAAATVAFLRFAGRGIPQPERRWLMAILVIAIVLRLAAVCLLLVATGADSQSLGVLLGDEGYLMRRTLRIRSLWLGYTGLAYDYVNAFEEYAGTGYMYLVGYLQMLFGPSPYSLRLVNAGVFVTATYVLYRIARHAYGPVAALGSLAVLLFLPTQFAWSISLLKESGYLLATALTLAAVIRAVRAPTLRKRLLWAGAAAAGALSIWPFRAQGVAILVVALMSAFVIWWAAQRPRRAFLFACAAPLVLWLAFQEPRIRARLLEGAQMAARAHIGHVFTVGHAYKTLDDRFYTKPSLVGLNLTPEEAGRFVVRSATSFVFVPLPWNVESTAERLYLPEHIVWLLMVALALIGIWPAFHKDVAVTAVLASYAFVTSAAVALMSGNVGTLIRHRSLSMPFLIWFSGVGVIWLIGLARKSADSAAPDATNTLTAPHGS
jgi:4-amino-4-deoxy-L-arabinose transferase-like glycosyltransferase